MTNLPPVQELSEAIVTETPWDLVHGFVENYEWRGDGDYTPSESECALIEDAMQGFLQLLQDRGYLVTELQHSRAAEAVAPAEIVRSLVHDIMAITPQFESGERVKQSVIERLEALASPASPSPAIGVRVSEAQIGDHERKRAIAAIHWVFSADGTKSERSMADEAINKISDPTFMPLATAPAIDPKLVRALSHVFALVNLYEDEHPEMAFDGHLHHEAVKSANAFYHGYWALHAARKQDDEEAV